MVLVRVDGGWEPAKLTSYESEAALQELLAGDTSLLPGCEGAAAGREVSIPGVGFVDVVLVDSDGVVTLVECKLQANPQMRREVIGQIIAYASGLQGLSYEAFDAAFSARAGASIATSVSAAAGSQVDPESLRAAVAEKLAAGDFRLVVAIDQITQELRGAVEYLNKHLNDSVSFMALELGYLQRDGLEILVPRTYGAELETQRPDRGPRRRWTDDDVAAALDQIGESERRDFLTSLQRHASGHGAVLKGGTSASPSGGYYYSIAGKRRSLWSLYLKPEGAVLAVNLGSVANGAPEVAAGMAAELRHSNSLGRRLPAPGESLEGKYPEYSVADLARDDRALSSLRAAFDLALSSALGTIVTDELEGPA